MGVLGGESREADGDVAGPRGRAIANALTGPRDDRLTGNHRGGLITVVNEEFSVHLTTYTREPMARIFVTEDRKAEARALIEEVTGQPPAERKL